MGRDIHLSIVKNGEYLAKNIFEGRNSDWFNNLLREGTNELYDYLMIRYGVSDEAPEEIFKDEEDRASGYYGFHYIKVGDYKEWFIKYNPDVDAGWVTRYEEWAYINKGISPDYLQKELHKEDIIADKVFIEVVDKYDCSRWLYDYLIENHISDDAVIQYFFDC